MRLSERWRGDPSLDDAVAVVPGLRPLVHQSSGRLRTLVDARLARGSKCGRMRLRITDDISVFVFAAPAAGAAVSSLNSSNLNRTRPVLHAPPAASGDKAP
jgi:hypothetical protein